MMSEQPYVNFMLQVLAQARAGGYTQAPLLQLTLWLVYRVFDINPRSVQAYLVLAHFFCLLGESDRALRVLAHYEQAFARQGLPEAHPIRQFQRAFQIKAAPAEADDTSTSTQLPSLQESLALLEATPMTVFAEYFEQALPGIQALAHPIKRLEQDP